jgi:hypothetical protein
MANYEYEIQLHNWMGDPVSRPYSYITGDTATNAAKQWLIEAGHVKFVRILRRKYGTYEYKPWKVVWWSYHHNKIMTSKRKDIVTK